MQSESWIEHGLRHKQNLWHWACLSTTLNQSGPFQQRCCFLTCASVSEYLWVCAQQWLRRCYNPQNPHSRSSWSLCLGHQCSLNAQLPGLVTRKGEDTPQAQRLLSSHSNGAVLWGYCYMLKAGGQILVFVDCLCINIKRNGTWQDRWIVNLCVCVISWYLVLRLSGCVSSRGGCGAALCRVFRVLFHELQYGTLRNTRNLQTHTQFQALVKAKQKQNKK